METLRTLLHAEPATPVRPEAPPPQPEPEQVTTSSPEATDWVTQEKAPSFFETLGDDWLGKLGLGLLLVGLAFLFRYSIDQGWLTPVVRLGFGAALGTFLLVTGVRVHEKRVVFGQLLLGGGISTYYATLFAAYQLYELLPYPIAFAGMVLVTVASFALAVRQAQALLAVLGTMGGLSIPFLLYNNVSNVPGLMGHTSLVLLVAGALYFLKGWRTLVAAAALGGGIVLAIADGPVETLLDRWALTLGACVYVAATWGVAVVRSEQRRRNPERWPVPGPALFLQTPLLHRPVLPLTLIVPFVTVLIVQNEWAWRDGVSWVFGLLLAGAFAAGAYVFQKKDVQLGDAMSGAALLFFLESAIFFPLSGGPALPEAGVMMQWAAALWVAHAVAKRLGFPWLRVGGHMLACVLGGWLTAYLLSGTAEGTPLLNLRALADFSVVAAMLLSVRVLRHPSAKFVYALFGYMALMAWLLRECSALPHGQAWASASWGVLALLVLWLAFRHRSDQLRLLGFLTLLLLVGKLFLVDLVRLGALTRVFLFLGLGGVFMLVSYFFPQAWQPFGEEDGSEALPNTPDEGDGNQGSPLEH